MSSGLIQTSLANPVTIAVVIIVLVLMIAGIVFVVLRSRAHRRERDALVRERLLEMDRVSQFAAAADQVRISRNPAEVALEIAKMFRDYLSMPVSAIYVGRESDATLVNALSGDDTSTEAPFTHQRAP